MDITSQQGHDLDEEKGKGVGGEMKDRMRKDMKTKE